MRIRNPNSAELVVVHEVEQSGLAIGTHTGMGMQYPYELILLYLSYMGTDLHSGPTFNR